MVRTNTAACPQIADMLKALPVVEFQKARHLLYQKPRRSPRRDQRSQPSNPGHLSRPLTREVRALSTTKRKRFRRQLPRPRQSQKRNCCAFDWLVIWKESTPEKRTGKLVSVLSRYLITSLHWQGKNTYYNYQALNFRRSNKL